VGLRLDERAIPEPRRLRPEQVPMQPGEQAFIFTVRQARRTATGWPMWRTGI